MDGCKATYRFIDQLHGVVVLGCGRHALGGKAAVFLLFPGPDASTEKRDFSRIGLLG